jgi:plasminogen activator
MKKTLLIESISKTGLVITAAIGLLLLTTQSHAGAVDQNAYIETSTESSGIIFTGNMGAGYLTGEAHETVYWPSNNNHKASELTWDIDSLYMLGIGGSVQLNWIKLNANIWLNIGDGDGYMEDYDWLEPGMAWTDRSTHDNTDVTSGVMFDTNAEMSVLSTEQVTIFGILGFRHDSFEWEARGGTYLYSVYGFRDVEGTFPHGTLGVTYEQTFDVPYAGIGVNANLDKLHIGAKLTGSIFVSGESVDHHPLRDLVVYDEFSNETMWAFDVGVSYDITNAINLKIAYAYERYESMTGDARWDYDREGYSQTISDSAGADLETSLLSLAMSYSF